MGGTESDQSSAPPTAPRTARWFWCASLGAFLALAMIIEPEGPLPLDTTLKRWIESGPFASTRLFWLALSWPGEHFWAILPMLLVACIALWRADDQRSAVVLAALFLAAAGTNLLVKGLVARARPVADEHELIFTQRYSFPSGHTVQYTCLFGFLASWCHRNVRRPRLRVVLAWSAAATVVLVGPARVILQAHWPTDVLAGYLYGYLWLGPAILAART